MKLTDIVNVINEIFCIESLFIFLIQLLVFLILCVVTFFFIYKPIKKKIKERNDFIENNIKEANQNKLISEKKLQEIEDKIVNTYNEADMIIADAKKKALDEYDDIVKKAHEDIEKEKLLAQKQIISEIKKSKQEIVDSVFDICESVLERNVNIEDNQKYVDHLVDNLIVDVENNEKN